MTQRNVNVNVTATKQNAKMYTARLDSFLQPLRRISKLTSFLFQISTDLDLLSLSDLNSGALCVQPADSLPSTSAEWLKTHGLKGVTVTET